jgi:hypothetical protein
MKSKRILAAGSAAKKENPAPSASSSRKRVPGEKYTAYAGFQSIPDEKNVKIELVVITDSSGKVFERLRNVSPIGDFVGTASDGKVKLLLRRLLLHEFDLAIKVEDIHLRSYPEVEKLLREGDPTRIKYYHDSLKRSG